jgi:hypothetical protein
MLDSVGIARYTYIGVSRIPGEDGPRKDDTSIYGHKDFFTRTAVPVIPGSTYLENTEIMMTEADAEYLKENGAKTQLGACKKR